MGFFRKEERRSLRRRANDVLEKIKIIEKIKKAESLTLWVEALVIVVIVLLGIQWYRATKATNSVARGVAEIGAAHLATPALSAEKRTVERKPAHRSKSKTRK